MRILHIATEWAPEAKAGGLGEVVSGLSQATARLGHEVSILLPYYPSLLPLGLKKKQSFPVLEGSEEHIYSLWVREFRDFTLYALESHHPALYFNRKTIYGHPDDLRRFLAFNRAATEWLKQSLPFDLLHLHDWMTAPMTQLVEELSSPPILVFSLHSAEHQGLCQHVDLKHFRISLKKTSDQPNLMKEALLLSDAVVTVSPTYAKEIQREGGGFGLEATFSSIRHKLYGILNGIDTEMWNSAKDPYLPSRFSLSSSFISIQKGKREAKKELSSRLGLSLSKGPWLSTICRLVPQKNPELIREALSHWVGRGGTFVFLGSPADPSIQKEFEELQAQYSTHPQCRLVLNFDEPLAHLFYAASDFFLIPSRFEPCGLTQMIAMQYGTIPIGRGTGGLKDTIFDWETSSFPFQKRNGLLFKEKEEMISKLDTAIYLFEKEPFSIENLIRHASCLDFSWKRAARLYEKLYLHLLEEKKKDFTQAI